MRHCEIASQEKEKFPHSFNRFSTDATQYIIKLIPRIFNSSLLDFYFLALVFFSHSSAYCANVSLFVIVLFRKNCSIHTHKKKEKITNFLHFLEMKEGNFSAVSQLMTHPKSLFLHALNIIFISQTIFLHSLFNVGRANGQRRQNLFQ